MFELFCYQSSSLLSFSFSFFFFYFIIHLFFIQLFPGICTLLHIFELFLHSRSDILVSHNALQLPVRRIRTARQPSSYLRSSSIVFTSTLSLTRKVVFLAFNLNSLLPNCL